MWNAFWGTPSRLRKGRLIAIQKYSRKKYFVKKFIDWWIGCLMSRIRYSLSICQPDCSHDKLQILVSCNNSNLQLTRNQELAPSVGELNINNQF